MKTKTRKANLPEVGIDYEYAYTNIENGKRVKYFRFVGKYGSFGHEFSEPALKALIRRNPDVTFIFLG